MKAPSDSRLARHRERVDRLRESMRERFDQGVDAVELVQSLALQTDGFLVELFDEAAEDISPDDRLAGEGAILAVGGSGEPSFRPGRMSTCCFSTEVTASRLRSSPPRRSATVGTWA
mgnify:CR=1 FL=1